MAVLQLVSMQELFLGKGERCPHIWEGEGEGGREKSERERRGEQREAGEGEREREEEQETKKGEIRGRREGVLLEGFHTEHCQ